MRRQKIRAQPACLAVSEISAPAKLSQEPQEHGGGCRQHSAVTKGFTEEATLRVDPKSPRKKEYSRYREEKVPSKAQDW